MENLYIKHSHGDDVEATYFLHCDICGIAEPLPEPPNMNDIFTAAFIHIDNSEK